MEFIVYSEDKADSLHIRQAARDDHLAWLRAPSDVKLLIAGPWLDDDSVMRGSLLIEAAGLTASVMVKAYKWVIGKP